MKKLGIFLLVMLMAGAFALAEDVQLQGGCELEPGVQAQMDLDDDGYMETLLWEQSEDEYGQMTDVLRVIGAEGKPTGFTFDSMYGRSMYVLDLDGDGRMEILSDGDWASDDYETTCIRYSGGAFQLIQFPNAARGKVAGDYLMTGYGYIKSFGENYMELCGSQDILGTHFGSRWVKLEGNRFEFADDGLWQFEYDFSDPEIWENWGALNPLQEIPAVIYENGQEVDGAIQPGEKFMVVASDKVSVVHFQTQSGRMGYFSIEPSADGWGCLINGIPESELFEMVPYAD